MRRNKIEVKKIDVKRSFAAGIESKRETIPKNVTNLIKKKKRERERKTFADKFEAIY